MRDGIETLAAEMATHGTRRGDPARAIMALVGDRWSTLILLVLSLGTWRHAELKRVLGELSSEGAISQRMLTLKLRALEREGMVARAVTADVPPRVSYALTALGAGLFDRVRDLLDWINANEAEIRSARLRMDDIG